MATSLIRNYVFGVPAYPAAENVHPGPRHAFFLTAFEAGFSGGFVFMARRRASSGVKG